jgi:serine/threonine protein kinase
VAAVSAGAGRDFLYRPDRVLVPHSGAGCMRAIQGQVADGVSTQRLGRYQLITRMAVGGMAEVFLARHGELAGFRTLVVVKKVLPHLASDPDFITMFLDEARIASMLDHPNLVRIVEVGRHGDEFFLAMELVQGKPLSSLLRRGLLHQQTIDPRVAAWIVAQAAAGLHHAHGLCGRDGQPLGLVHRDVSPQNILVSFEGAVKVIDFGIAGAVGRLTETGTGGLKGKLAYMAPEQARAEPMDRRADVFALGVVLWESLCCRRLFARTTDVATLSAVLEDPIPLPSTVAKVPAAIEAIVMKALCRDPAGRYQSAQELSQALERFAFQGDGCSTGDVAELMKRYFGGERARWATTTRLALEMADPSDSTHMRQMKLTQTGLPIGTPVPTGRLGGAGPWAVTLGVVAALAVTLLILLPWGRSAPPAAVTTASMPQPSTPRLSPPGLLLEVAPVPMILDPPPASPKRRPRRQTVRTHPVAVDEPEGSEPSAVDHRPNPFE